MKTGKFMLTLCIFMMFQLPFLLFAQINCRISGKVSDKNGKPLEYVLLTLYRYQQKDSVKKMATFTDLKGNYSFIVIDTGNYAIKASQMGYTAQLSPRQHCSISKTVLQSNLLMSENSTQLSEVAIKGKKPLIERKADRLIFNVEGSAVAAGNPLLEVMRMVPGLAVVNDKLNIRGKEGLIVMIDNRRSYMSGDELLSYLKNTPAESIAQLEIISNPSAKYDAEGNVGIVHIRTKKNTATGTTGTLSQTIGIGKYLKSTTGGQLSYVTEKLILFGNSYLSYNKSYDNYGTTSYIDNGDQINSNNHNIQLSKNNYSYQAGFDYRLHKNSNFGAVLEGSLRPGYQSLGTSKVEKTGTQPQFIQSLNPSATDNRNISANLHYSLNNDNNTALFSADANYVSYSYDLQSRLTDEYYANAQYEQGNLPRQEQLRNRSLRAVDVWAGKADYNHKWSEKHSLESGLKWSQVQTNSDLAYESLQNTIWENDPGRTNQYLFKEQIYAAYLNYNGQFGKYSIQTGLRAEQTSNKGFSKTLNSEVKRNYLKLFPSIFISSNFGKDHSWSAAYSYRIDRPTYSHLNPFTFINNPYSYFRGNPYLKPQYTHNLEANYDFRKKLFLSLSYQHTVDMISEVAEQGVSAGIIGGTRANLNGMDSYSFSVNAPFQLTENWEANIYLGVFNNRIRDIKGFSNQQTTFTTSFTTSFNLPAAVVLDLNGNYQSAMSYGTMLLDPIYGFNAGLKKSFMDKKISLRLNVSDVFKVQKLVYHSAYAGISTFGLNTSESRVFRLTATYKFGKVKAAAQRKTGVEEEQKRARN
ncbi:hypothetical protein DBR43_08920 [Pedobacter sp. KBW06]|uniref:TonB-dependent receptor domain-containing protein n=1 Tax=Pedobacter sp. KBW06 TaxID=2153359 RepID=UPI000F5954DA|nr:TonB-dependent receptor [Pedobacter sp. KBW06]RQO75459.1 hypothetical protein DBR43_08920 [Pedobacter sp. KBW06]